MLRANTVAWAKASVFALSIQPYINSSIIIQLLTIAIPALERLQKEGGEEGKKKIAAITRYTTVGIALLQGFGYYTMINSYSDGMGNPIVNVPDAGAVRDVHNGVALRSEQKFLQIELCCGKV